jgi:hypothetical protein
MTLGEQEPPVAGVLHEAPAGLGEAEVSHFRAEVVSSDVESVV